MIFKILMDDYNVQNLDGRKWIKSSKIVEEISTFVTYTM
jgi:hypothetical protein